MAAAYQFKPLIGGGAQRAPIQNQRAQPTSKSGLAPSAGMNVDIPEGAVRDSALRATFVDKEEAAMLRAMARLNGDDAKSRDFGNRNSQVNRKKAVARQQEAAAMGLTPLDPHEQHQLQKKMEAGYTTISERAVRVPRVGVMAPRPRPAMIDIIVHRKPEEVIREENDDFERPQAPPGRPYRSVEDKKDELALRNQFNGQLPHELLQHADRVELTLDEHPAAGRSVRVQHGKPQMRCAVVLVRPYGRLGASAQGGGGATRADESLDARTDEEAIVRKEEQVRRWRARKRAARVHIVEQVRGEQRARPPVRVQAQRRDQHALSGRAFAEPAPLSCECSPREVGGASAVHVQNDVRRFQREAQPVSHRRPRVPGGDICGDGCGQQQAGAGIVARCRSVDTRDWRWLL